jgi:hypothetical protein
MTEPVVKRWQPKPSKREDRGLVTARYSRAEPLDAIREVAVLADEKAEIATAVFIDGPVVLVRYQSQAAAQVRWVVVRPGFHLAYDREYRSLREVTDTTLTQFDEEP